VFGTRARPRRPILLIIVFGLFLVIVGVTATAQAVLVSIHFETAKLTAVVDSDASTVRAYVNSFIGPADLTGAAPPARTADLDASLSTLADRGSILRIEIRDPSGVVRLGSDPASIGLSAAGAEGFRTALAGETVAGLVPAGEPTDVTGSEPPSPELLREYFPLVDPGGDVAAVFVVWRDAGPILAELAAVRLQVVVITLTAALLAGLFLYLIFRAAQGRIGRQTEALLEAARRDSLTGLLSHGSIVDELAVAVDGARDAGTSVALILFDVDNFRNLDVTHGHAVGDRVLQRVATAVAGSVPAGGTVGRYGPDEFLIVARDTSIDEAVGVAEAVRAALADDGLELDDVEPDGHDRLPLSVSAGVSTYPRNGASVTALLSEVTLVLAEAKASGGDAVRVSGGTRETTPDARSFDVLQGLVFAIDTKDRYTKRHSEDVARYAVFLARLLGVDEAFAETIRMAGLLHDVGKIGVPDAVLRKPGRLSADERAMVEQHVALGDSIIRNLEDVEVIRAGVRNHHERWDGRGYLAGLAGDEIPLVARILAVGDAFSAMTTTRPYRKALPVDEALRRLGDAAGTQLDERLVERFIRGFEHERDVPLPGVPEPSGLWLPRTNAA
jgi:diguanylate cyclase (GGDEF)-like protein/putative nucleotidyltransferase with HDIG domain